MSNASKINTVELTNAEIYELLDAITCTEREIQSFLQLVQNFVRWLQKIMGV